MILGGDFNFRLDLTERGNLLCEFLINWNLHCVNDNEVTYEFQCGKSVIDLVFVSKELLEHFNEIKINNSFLTKHKPVSCCFDLKRRHDIAESRKKQMRKLDVEQLNERMNSQTYASETYGDELFEIEIKQPYRKIEAVFWKSWCGVSKYTSTTTLSNKLMFHDIHGLKDCPPKHRRVIAKFYANGLHNNFCCMEGCYQWEENLYVCRFCERTLLSNDHFHYCSHFLNLTPLQKFYKQLNLMFIL